MKILIKLLGLTILSSLSYKAQAISKSGVVCNYCTADSMKLAAKSRAATYPQLIYVADMINENYKKYRVQRIVEPGFQHTMVADQQPDASEIEMFESAFDTYAIVKSLATNGIPVSDLPSLWPGSALEVIGNIPVQRGIANSLSQYISTGSGLGAASISVLNDLTDVALGSIITVLFPDGSTMSFKVSATNVNAVTGEIVVDFEYKPNSTFDDHNRNVPDNLSDLAGTTFHEIHSNHINSWIAMLERRGVPVTNWGSGSGLGRVECVPTNDGMICTFYPL